MYSKSISTISPEVMLFNNSCVHMRWNKMANLPYLFFLTNCCVCCLFLTRKIWSTAKHWIIVHRIICYEHLIDTPCNHLSQYIISNQLSKTWHWVICNIKKQIVYHKKYLPSFMFSRKCKTQLVVQLLYGGVHRNAECFCVTFQNATTELS